MNKQIILQALQTQLQTVKAEAVAHEEQVYNPALAALVSKIKVYFDQYIAKNIYDIQISSDRITVFPNDDTSYGNSFTIDYRASWRDEGGYFETSSYRPDLKSNTDNTTTIHYYNVLVGIANNFSSLCDKYKTKWLPAFNKIESAKSEKYNEIWKIEREIRSCEAEIATIEKEAYNQVGFECTLKPYANYDSHYDNNECVYTKKFDDKHIKAQYGRSRWDYYYINSFKVISFPKAKYGKVVLEFKQQETDKTRTAELNKARYAEFINEVYHWQNSGAASREEDIDERVERYSKAEA